MTKKTVWLIEGSRRGLSVRVRVDASRVAVLWLSPPPLFKKNRLDIHPRGCIILSRMLYGVYHLITCVLQYYR